MTERNKQKVRLFVEAVLNEGRLELIEELVAADFVGHMTGVSSPVVGPAEVRRLVSRGRSSYADIYIKIEDQIARGRPGRCTVAGDGRARWNSEQLLRARRSVHRRLDRSVPGRNAGRRAGRMPDRRV